MQQQVFPASGVPAAHAGWGLDTPSASTAIRIWTKVFKHTSTLQHYLPREYFKSRDADYIPQPMGHVVAAGAALPLMMEPQVAMEVPKGLETVVPVWSQWAFSIGQ